MSRDRSFRARHSAAATALRRLRVEEAPTTVQRDSLAPPPPGAPEAGRLDLSYEGPAARSPVDAVPHGLGPVPDTDGCPEPQPSGARPGVLTSAVFHVVLLTLLALLTQSPQRDRPTTTLLASVSDKPAPLEQVLTLPLEPDVAPPEDASSRHSDLVDSADFPAPPAIKYFDPAAGSSALGTTLRSRGALFGTAVGGSGSGTGPGGQGQGDGQATGGDGVEFFGVKAAGNRFVFVVDSSISMIQKVHDARKELEYAIRQLSKQQKFYVIFFDQNTEFMRLGKWNQQTNRYEFNPRPEPGLVPATSANVDAFVRWMQTIQLQFATNPYEAMIFAVNKLRPDAIFLLSDGEFTDRGATELFLRDYNVVAGADGQRRPKSVVHCIGFYSRRGEVALKRIAETNGGTYRFVEPPPGYVPKFRGPRIRPPGPRK